MLTLDSVGVIMAELSTRTAAGTPYCAPLSKILDITVACPTSAVRPHCNLIRIAYDPAWLNVTRPAALSITGSVAAFCAAPNVNWIGVFKADGCCVAVENALNTSTSRTPLAANNMLSAVCVSTSRILAGVTRPDVLSGTLAVISANSWSLVKAIVTPGTR